MKAQSHPFEVAFLFYHYLRLLVDASCKSLLGILFALLLFYQPPMGLTTCC